MDPLLISFFFFFFFSILSPLLYTISSLLSSLCSPSCLRTHPTLTPEKLNSPTSHNSHPTSNNSLLCTCVFRSHPPLITLNRSPTSHNSHQTNNFLLCTLISEGPKPKYTKEITRPTSISLTHLTPHPPHPSRIQPHVLLLPVL